MTPKHYVGYFNTHSNSVMLLCFPKRANIDFTACVDKCKVEAGMHSVQCLGVVFQGLKNPKVRGFTP